MLEMNQVYLLIAKIVELVLYLLVFFSLNKKYRGTPFKMRPSLHRFFVLGIGGWVVYMFLDAIIYVIAPLSIPESAVLSQSGLIFSGYLLEYPSLYIANILRDIAIPGALLMAWTYCAAAVQINNGININERFFFARDRLFSNSKIITISRGIIFQIIAALGVIGLVALDRIDVRVIDDIGGIHVTSGWGIINSIVILGFFTYAAVLMFKQLRFLKTTSMEAEFKQRATNIGRGIISYTAGLYYWAITGIISQWLEANTALILIFLFLGHVIWSLSAVFIYLAYRTTERGLKNDEE